MRFGRLLAEDAPAALIQTYGQTSLEAVFLSLCMDNGDTDEESRTSSKEGSVELETIVTRQPANIISRSENLCRLFAIIIRISLLAKY